MESDVHWDRDGMELEDPAGHETARLVATTTKKPGFLQRWRQRRKKLKALVRRRGRRLEPSARVDWTGALRLEAVSVDESGLYSCSLVDGITALAADIRVVRRKSFTISDVSRHASYLLGVILLCLMVYLTVIAIACRLYPRRQQGYRPLQLSADDADRASDHDDTAERERPVRLSARRGDGLATTTLVQRRPISAPSLAASICFTDELRTSSTSSSPTDGARGTPAALGFVAGSSSEQDGGSLRLRSLLRPRPGAVESISSALTTSSNTTATGDERLYGHPLLAASVCLVEDKAISSGEQEQGDKAGEPSLSQAD
ncbi:hypothetical protein FOCC_FOCC009129 [Frankliniella occidentalis]|nr:hypothetical protein FOCC_FOCC009129 [Frankliniella occidentalis]